MGGAQDGSLACRQCRLQVFPPTDLDQPPQGPCPVPQPLHVDRPAGGEPEPVPGYLLRRRRAELVTEHQPHVACHLGACPGLATEEQVAIPACDAVAQGGRQAARAGAGETAARSGVCQPRAAREFHAFPSRLSLASAPKSGLPPGVAATAGNHSLLRILQRHLGEGIATAPVVAQPGLVLASSPPG